MEKKGQEFLGIKDVIRRVEAAKARERQARLERVVVDDFVKRRKAAIRAEASMRESVQRYAVTHIGHGGVRTLAQGSFTYATKAEAQAWINAAMMENSKARLKESYGLPLEVRACRCRAGNFDPKEIYFDYGARS